MLLLGASGAGKSTLLLALAGLLDPEGGGEAEGTLLVAGRDPRAARDATGIVFQDPETQLVMARCGDDVAFGLENRCVPTAEIWPRVHGALASVAFPYPDDHRTDALSGGEKQRLALAGAIALEPRLLLLDEPTANLDPEGASQVRATIGALVADRRRALVIVEHRLAEIVPLVDRVVVVAAGAGVVADGAPADVFAREGQRLAAQGVWVPGLAVAAPPRATLAAGAVLATADALSFRYPGAGRNAVDDVSLEARAGEAIALTGANGSGKSTLALLLAGLLRPLGGTARLGTDDAWRLPARRLVTRVGSVFQDPEHQFVASSVREELAIGPRRAGRDERTVRSLTDALLERLHLAHLAEANPFTLSGGEQRRLSVATAVATAPPLLVLDEPTFGQDRRTYAELATLLARHREEGGGIVFATHDADLVRGLADRVITMRGGRAA